jgi:hypothetical protein
MGIHDHLFPGQDSAMVAKFLSRIAPEPISLMTTVRYVRRMLKFGNDTVLDFGFRD